MARSRRPPALPDEEPLRSAILKLASPTGQPITAEARAAFPPRSSLRPPAPYRLPDPPGLSLTEVLKLILDDVDGVRRVPSDPLKAKQARQVWETLDTWPPDRIMDLPFD